MGYSTPKKPFDLKEFLAAKPTRRSVRWNKRPIPATPADAANADADPNPDLPEPEPNR